MKKSLFIISFIVLIIMTVLGTAQANTIWYSCHNNSNNVWRAKTVELGLDYFTIDIPSDITTLTTGTALYSNNDPNKYVTFNTDLTLIDVTDPYEAGGDLAMFSTDPSDEVIMSLHGFDALGFGLQLGIVDGTYKAGIEYAGMGIASMFSSTYYPYFLGPITDGADSITNVTVYAKTYNVGTGEYSFGGPLLFGDLHFIEQDAETNAVPEPATIVLLGAGLVGMALRRRKA